MSAHLSPNGCPSDPADIAELYCLNRLQAEDKLAFEDHYMTCPKCAEEVEKTQRFVEAMRAAGRRLKRDKPKD